MTGFLTCLFLIVLAGLSAEAVRATCRRRLLTPLAPLAPLAALPPARHEPSPSLGEFEYAGVPDLA